MDQESNPHVWIAALRSSQNRLVSVVEPLTPGEIRGPSYHSWTIAQVLSHMGSQAEIFMAWLQVSLDGGDLPGRESMEPVWEKWNAKTPDEQVHDSIECNEEFLRATEALSQAELDRMHLNLFGMELDAAGVFRLRLGEHVLHTWDVEVALNPGARLAPDAVNLLVDTVGPLAARSGKAADKRFILSLHTEGPERSFTLRVDEEVALTDGVSNRVDGDLRMPSEALIRLVYGRLDREHMPPVELSAPGITLDDVLRVFPGF